MGLEQALQCIPPTVYYHPDMEPKFKTPQFVEYCPLFNEESVNTIFDTNILPSVKQAVRTTLCLSRKQAPISSRTDFTGNKLFLVTMPIEIRGYTS